MTSQHVFARFQFAELSPYLKKPSSTRNRFSIGQVDQDAVLCRGGLYLGPKGGVAWLYFFSNFAYQQAVNSRKILKKQFYFNLMQVGLITSKKQNNLILSTV